MIKLSQDQGFSVNLCVHLEEKETHRSLRRVEQTYSTLEAELFLNWQTWLLYSIYRTSCDLGEVEGPPDVADEELLRDRVAPGHLGLRHALRVLLCHVRAEGH